VLRATRHKWTRPALTPANKAGTWFTYPRRMEGWVDLGSLIAAWPGIEPSIARSRVRCPNHYNTDSFTFTEIEQHARVFRAKYFVLSEAVTYSSLSTTRCCNDSTKQAATSVCQQNSSVWHISLISPHRLSPLQNIYIQVHILEQIYLFAAQKIQSKQILGVCGIQWKFRISVF